MRRTDRQLDYSGNLAELLDEFKVIRIGCADDQGQYIVPLNYGYEVEGDTCTFYIHSAGSGRKVAIFDQSPVVAFELDGRHELRTASQGCDYSFNYLSLIGQAKVEPVLEDTAKIKALARIMSHYEKNRENVPFTKNMVAAVKVYRLIVADMAGKQRNI